MIYRTDRVVWGAVLFRTTNPAVIEGAIVRRSERLHWTSQSAKEEVLEWTQELPQLTPLAGSSGEALKTLRLAVLPTTPIMLLW
jgi:hypothetical protein